MEWRRTKEYREWRIGVIRRDTKCVVCGSIKGRQAHHLNHASFFPIQRFNLDNGVTLCTSCHSQYHNNYHKSTKEKCTVDAFVNFMKLVEYFKQKEINVRLNDTRGDN